MRIRKRQSTMKLAIIASSIIMLNTLGISYAYWNNDANMSLSLSTGFLNPCFTKDGIKIIGNSEGKVVDAACDSNVENCDLQEELTVSIIDDNVLNITGKSYQNLNKKISIKVRNYGSLPIIYKSVNPIEENEIVKQIQYNGNSLIQIDEEKEIIIHLQTGNKKELKHGEHSFCYELQFEQGAR